MSRVQRRAQASTVHAVWCGNLFPLMFFFLQVMAAQIVADAQPAPSQLVVQVLYVRRAQQVRRGSLPL